MTPIAAPTPALDRLFAALRRSPVTRSSDRALAGVCGGVADGLGVSVKAVRIVTVLLAFTGAAIPLYLIGWLLLPDRTGTIHLERAVRQGRPGSLALLVVTVLTMLPDAHVHHHTGHGFIPFIAFVALAAFLFTRFRGGWRHPGTPGAPRRTDGPQDVRRS